MLFDSGQRIANKTTGPVKVLVVDDSAFMRHMISYGLNKHADITVVGTAHDGKEALEVIPDLQPDVVTLDVLMPQMDGLSTLRQIMARFPRPVIMLSSLTDDGAVETIQALTYGAVDFVAKPAGQANVRLVLDDVANKVVQAARMKTFRVPVAKEKVVPVAPSVLKPVRPLTASDPIVLIGTSTGGPRALNELIPMLPANLPAAVVIVQHMPAGFTRSLAERLNQVSPLYVKEAEPGDTLAVGQALLAPGGFHMLINSTGRISLNQDPPVHGVRPAVDVSLVSLAQRFGKRVIAVIMTGMGSDGTNGAALLHSMGGYVIAEDESSCVVYGMPRSVVESGSADEVVPLPNLAGAIQNVVRNYLRTAVA